MPESLTRKKTPPTTARVADFKSEWWPDLFRNRGRLQIGIPAGFTSVHPAGLNRNPHLRGIRTSSTLSDLPARQEPRQILALLKALKGQGWRSPKKLFQFLNNIGARAQRMHLGRVLEMAESSRNRYVSENKILERFGGQQELELVVPTPPATKSDLPPPDEPPLR
jgi:hypothetical protein